MATASRGKLPRALIALLPFVIGAPSLASREPQSPFATAVDAHTEPASISVGTADVSVVVATKVVKEVHEPEGGVYGFAYDQPGLLDRTGLLEQAVTDPRGKVTHYDLNQFGAAVKVTDPLGGITETDWDLAEVVPRSITDANRNVTHFEHDEFGNETLQETTVTDADGHERTVSRVTTYKPPAQFDPPYVKSRPATKTDRDGAATSFEYDSAGNLRAVTQVVHEADGTSSTYTTAHTYYDNGDLQSTTNPRHVRTSFAYDAYGNVETVTDPEGDTVTHWSVRSEPRETSRSRRN